MTDTQAPDVVVTEADRELFLALQLYSASSAVDVARGMADRSRNMQKIAAFRLSTQSAMQARIEELEAALTRAESDFHLIALDSTISYRLQGDAKRARDNCRAALSSAIGDEFSGWVEVVEDDRE